jgi:GATA-binding protein
VALPDLPPLPDGFSLENLAQFGSSGLELAIRIGMGIGLSLQQGGRPNPADPANQNGALNAETMQRQLAQLMQQQSLMKQGGAASPSEQTAGHLPGTPGPRSSDVVKDILNDDFFSIRNPSTPGATPGLIGGNGAGSSKPTSRRTSNAGELPLISPMGNSPIDPSAMPFPGNPQDLAKKDPLATQVWKAYAKAKGGLPNGPRMENLTWRMMHLTMKKPEDNGKSQSGMELVKEEDEAAELAEEADKPGAMAGEEVERGRRGRFKGKGRVVGFDAESPQGQQEE